MYEHSGQPLLSRRRFVRRVLGHGGLAVAILGASLAAGVLGYAALEGMSALDAFLNAAMILGGMGPASALATPAGKLFAGVYALYCGLVLLATAGIVLTPFVHRLMHHVVRGGRVT